MKYNAYWLSPRGKLIGVDKRHIDLIMTNPEIFKLSKIDLINKYKKYGERLGLEGKAREEIMKNLMKKGWIRIRYYPRDDKWQLQVFYHLRQRKPRPLGRG